MLPAMPLLMETSFDGWKAFDISSGCVILVLMKLLTDAQLEKLNTKRLLALLKVVRKVELRTQHSFAHAAGGMCCEVCNEWIDGEEKYRRDVLVPTAYLTVYKDTIKKILKNREHVK